jgi:sugar lactone lactonase YvrE
MKASPRVLVCALCPALSFAADSPPWRVETIAGTGRGELTGVEGGALSFGLNQPFGVEVGAAGDLFICEVGNHRVLRLDLASRRVTTIAGNGKKGRGGEGVPAVEAALNEPYEVRLDGLGGIYFVEMAGALVRKVEGGLLRTVAGTGEHGYGGDGGPAVKAQFQSPHSIALDRKGGLYVADIGNHRIRKVDLQTGLITTIAGNGEAALPAAGPAAGKPMLGPRALAVTDDTLWIALREGHSVWKLDLASGVLAHVAGTGKAGFQDGPAVAASFNGPKGIAAWGGALYVMDTENHALRRIEIATGTVSTLAGGGPQSRGYGGDGGPALPAKFDRPHGVAAAAGVIYIGDSENHRVRGLRPEKK